MSSVAPPEDVLSHGVLGGQVVGNDAANDLQLVRYVEQKLIQRMRRSIDAIDPASFKSGGERSKVSATPFRTWTERRALYDPSQSYLGMGHVRCVAVPPDAHPMIKEIVSSLPSHIEQIQIWLERWEDSPGRERND
jgi:hypothetical protein